MQKADSNNFYCGITNSIVTLATRLKPGFILCYLSLTGFAGIMAVQKYFGLKYEPIICLCFTGMVFSIYTFNRFTDAKEDFRNDIGKYFFFKNQKFFFPLAVASTIIVFGILIVTLKLNWLHVSLLLSGFFYSYRAFPWYSKNNGLHVIRLKEVIFLKNLLVSFWWPTSILAFPILFSGRRVDDLFLLTLIGSGLFLTILNNTLFHDIMDENGDRLTGIRTLPTIWGSKKSYQFLFILNSLWVACITLFFLQGKLDLAHALFLSFLTIYPATYISLYLFQNTSRLKMELLSESDLILFSVGLFFLKSY